MWPDINIICLCNVHINSRGLEFSVRVWWDSKVRLDEKCEHEVPVSQIVNFSFLPPTVMIFSLKSTPANNEKKCLNLLDITMQETRLWVNSTGNFYQTIQEPVLHLKNGLLDIARPLLKHGGAGHLAVHEALGRAANRAGDRKTIRDRPVTKSCYLCVHQPSIHHEVRLLVLKLFVHLRH